MHWAWLKYFYEFEFTKEPFMLVQLEDPAGAVRYAAGVYKAERLMDDPHKDCGNTMQVKLQDVDKGGEPVLYSYNLDTDEVLELTEPDQEWPGWLEARINASQNQVS